MMRQLRFCVRNLLRTPGFSLVAILTMALGIGANTAIFSVVNTVLFHPLPTRELDRLAVVREDLPDLNLMDAELAPAEVMDLSAMGDVFQAVTGFRPSDRTLTGYGEPMRLSTVSTLGDFAGVFGVQPYLGRLYRPEQSTDGTHNVAVVSYGLWQQISGGDRSFLGKTIELNGTSYEVIGIMPPDFRYPRQVQIWMPFQYTDRWKAPQMRGSLFMTTVGRLHPGVTHEQLAARLGAEVGRWNQEYHAGGAGKVLSATPFVEFLAGSLRRILFVLTGAVAFVLLIAAANVASLQLVRAAGRSKEMAVRVALGAGRGRVLRDILMESVLLAVAGGVVGLGIGRLALSLLAHWGPAQQMNLTEIPQDGRVLAFTMAVSLLTAVGFGLVPAWRGSRVDPQETLRASSPGASLGAERGRLLRASVVVQVALALVLLLGSGLMIRTLSHLLGTSPGFDPRNLSTAQLSIPGKVYDAPEKSLGFYDALLERTRALPGVDDAALVWGLPFSDQTDSSPFDIPSRPAREGDPKRHAEARIVSGGYFRTMRIPLLRGRDFDGTEAPGTPTVALIDQTFAEQFFPDQDPVGRQIVGYTGDLTTIIGVVGRVDHHQIGDAPKAVTYYSNRQQPWRGGYTTVVRSTLPAGSITSALRSAVAEMDPSVPLYDVQTMEGRIERSLGPRRLAMLALVAFAAISLLLATLGIYGVLRYTTKLRTREIGIRVALGAQPGSITRLVIRQGLVMTLLGLGIGILASLGLARLMSAILYGITPHDPVAFLVATALLAAVALLACYLPARRATQVDPMIALRSE